MIGFMHSWLPLVSVKWIGTTTPFLKYLFLPPLVRGMITLLIYIDATHQNIGHIPHIKRGFFKSWYAGEWAFLCTMLGPLFLFAYLIKRKSLITASRAYPVHLGRFHKLTVCTIVITYTCVSTFMLYPNLFHSF